MRHVFVLNPVAGKDRLALVIRGKIDAYFARHPEMEHRIYLTDGVGAATRIAREECEADGPVRLYACGGDGTLQETASGIPVGSDAELAVIPCGSGNDFVRTFGVREDFMDLPALIEGEAFPVDAIDCGGKLSLNIASMGMDASVGQKMLRYKNLPGVNGSMAYNLAVVDVFCHPIGEQLDIEIDGVDGPITRSGRYLLAVAGNGRYYGGGYCGAPEAIPDDGILNFTLIKKISRLKIPGFLGRFKSGKHDGLDCCEHISGTAMRVKAANPLVCNVDGECFSSDRISFSLVRNAFHFVLPKPLAEAKKAEMAERTVGVL